MKNSTLFLLLFACTLLFTSGLYAQDVIDLSGIDNPEILADTLPDVADGAIILLEPGKTYNHFYEDAGGYALDKSVEFHSSDPEAAEMPRIDCRQNFNFVDGANVGSVVFKNIAFYNGEDGWDNRYVFNVDVSATVGEIVFESCNIRSIRGIVRLKDGEGVLDKFTLSDCVIDSIRNYGIITVDDDAWMCNDILIENSTISRTEQFLQSRNNSNSVVIQNCNLDVLPKTGKQLFRWRTSGQDNVTNGITLRNIIISHAWDLEVTGGVVIDGFDGLGETAWTVENCYATNEYSNEGKDTIPGFPTAVYAGTADELWVDRANGDYHFLDASFAGAGTAGDPRWAGGTGQEIVDLSTFDNPEILADTLPDVADGAIILLGPGKTYNHFYEDAGGYALEKSIEFRSSDPEAAEMPRIDCRQNFNFVDGANVGSVVFKNIAFYNGEDGWDNRYVFNVDVSATVGEIVFESCNIRSIRGIVRLKDGEGVLDKFTLSDCVVDSIRNYGILTVDDDAWMCNDILIENSTISHTEQFLQSMNNSNSVILRNCTLDVLPKTGKQLFRWRTSGQDNVTNGITLQNIIISHAWDLEVTGGVVIDGFDGLGETPWTVENCYATSEYSNEGKDTIPGFPTAVYAGTADELWVDRANGDYNILDGTFAGLGTAGDPRWTGTPVEVATEWNFSDEDFNSLGEITETVTIKGLTIYANSGKKVTIDENNKSLDGIDFTHRLKLGGSGDFDDQGNPLGRVLAFDVNGDTKITVYGMSSSSSEDRVLMITEGDKDTEVGQFAALGPSISKGEFDYLGGPTTIYLYSPSSGVNLYYVKTSPVVPDLQEWNISNEDFNALGEISETVTINGLTIHAHSGKKVTIDDNNKSLDGMDFTHRLKLGGSGDFDDEGNPLGRVLTFEVTGNTKITVYGMSSSGSEDRVLMITAGDKDTEVGQFAALGASISKGEFTYEGEPSTIFLYSPASGVNIYYIKAEKLASAVITHKIPDLEVYPNPATDKVFVNVTKPTDIAIYNIAGKVVIQKRVNSSRESINLSNLPSGLYLIRSLNNAGFAKKLIKR